MAIDFKATKFAGRFPEIWRGECKMLPGGFKPVQEFAAGTVIRRGTPIYVDFENMTAAVCKSAKVLTGGTTTAPRVGKGHLFAVGDTVTKNGDGNASPTIRSIDTSNTEYDTITLSAAYTGLAAGDIIVESDTYSDTAVGSKYEPNMVVGADKEFDGKGLPTIDAAYDAVVLYPSLQFPILEEWLSGVCLKNNPNILFIRQ